MKFTEVCITNGWDWRKDEDHIAEVRSVLAIIGIELHFDELFGFCRSGFPAPLVHCIIRRLG